MLQKLSIIFLFLLIALPGSARAQSKADEHYEKGEFIKAIPLYKKESRSKNESVKQHAFIQLGNSYKAINNYTLAEEAYRSAAESGAEFQPEAAFNYAQILKINNKYDEAAVQ